MLCICGCKVELKGRQREFASDACRMRFKRESEQVTARATSPIERIICPKCNHLIDSAFHRHECWRSPVSS